jgi:hypothetical protein
MAELNSSCITENRNDLFFLANNLKVLVNTGSGICYPQPIIFLLAVNGFRPHSFWYYGNNVPAYLLEPSLCNILF